MPPIAHPIADSSEAERRIAELTAQLEEKSAEVELLHEVIAKVAAAPDTEAMLQFIAEIAVRVTGTESSSIYVFDRTRQNLVLKAVHRSEEHTSELQSRVDLVCRLLLEKKKMTCARLASRNGWSRSGARPARRDRT